MGPNPLMDKPRPDTTSRFSQPIRQIVMMLIATALVGFGAWLIHAQVLDIMRTNPLLNGFIGLVFLLGILTCFWQVLILI